MVKEGGREGGRVGGGGVPGFMTCQRWHSMCLRCTCSARELATGEGWAVTPVWLEWWGDG